MMGKAKIFAIISLIMILTISNAGCGSNTRSNTPATTTEPAKTEALETQQVQTTQTQQPTSTTEPTAPLEFTSKYSHFVKAGEPFEITFSIKNNTDIPFIAAYLAFENLDIAERIMIDQKWFCIEGEEMDNYNYYRQNIFIKTGQRYESKFNLLIMNPGTYQLIIVPSVKIGDWRSIGEYIASFQVSDTPEAKNIRHARIVIGSNTQSIIGFEERIKRLQRGIHWDQGDINYWKSIINASQRAIKLYEGHKKDRPDRADIYDNWIEMENEQLQNANDQITKIQAEIDAADKEIQMLTAKKDELLKQNEQLKEQLKNN